MHLQSSREPGIANLFFENLRGICEQGRILWYREKVVVLKNLLFVEESYAVSLRE